MLASLTHEPKEGVRLSPQRQHGEARQATDQGSPLEQHAEGAVLPRPEELSSESVHTSSETRDAAQRREKRL